MNNKEIAKVFQDIADLLELKKENPFKVRAYQKVARSIEHLPVEAERLVAENRLKEIPGAGKAIIEKITELVTTGRLDYYVRLKSDFPEGISVLLGVPGIGPKIAMLLSSELGIDSIDELETAILDGKVASLYHMGNKTAENILYQIKTLRRKDQRIPIGEALPIVGEISAYLSDVPGLKNLVSAGSLRRFRETVGDIDLMGTADNATEVIHAFTDLPLIKEVLVSGTTKASVVVVGGLQVDLRIVEHDSFGSLLQHFTGSKQHNVNLRERVHRKGLKLSEYGITDLATRELEKFATEEDFYHRQGLTFIPPEIREGQHEIEMAEQNTLPRLVEVSDIKGDFHIHTSWSEGRGSIEIMALAAKKLGYQYISITDHSRGRGIAHGLDPERLKQQVLEIKELNSKISGIHIFSGLEVDIRADGTLDMPEDILAELDIVVAAVHSSLNQGREQMTRRVIKSMENPNIDVLAHPTCRLLSGREPLAIDMEAIFQTAAKTNTMLEINAMPSRLDLKDTHIQRAKELGVKLVINTDAHNSDHLKFMHFGVGLARRGWCQAHDIVNTRPLGEVVTYLSPSN